MTTSRRLTPPRLRNGLLPTPTLQQGRNHTSGRPPDSKHHTGTTLNDLAYLHGHGHSLPDTPASRSVLPELATARTTPGISGRGLFACLPRLVRKSPAGSVLKTLLATSRLGSTVCSMTWKVRDTPAGRPLFRLLVSARSTSATASGSSGFLPTPTVQDGENTAGPSQWQRNSAPLNVVAARQMWATPRASASETRTYRRTPGHRKEGTRHGEYLQVQALVAEGQEGNTSRKLNPLFVERLMGYPDNWTTPSRFSAADANSPSP